MTNETVPILIGGQWNKPEVEEWGNVHNSFFGDLHVQGMEGVMFYTR